MKILFAASEVYPIAKTGGLADVAGSLPKALAGRGHDVSVIMPCYGGTRNGAVEVGKLRVPMGEGKVEDATLLKCSLPGDGRIPVLLIDHPRHFGNRPGLYGFHDDGYRFAFFSRAVVEAMRLLGEPPDVVHCHDWHTGLVPAYLSIASSPFDQIPKIFTIHNLAYQGVFDREVYGYTGLPESMFNLDGVEYYSRVNFLKAGVVYSERVNTVSPTYAREIQSHEFGNGLHGLLLHHTGKLTGIVNGIDYDVWDPGADPFLGTRYGPEDVSAKLELKRELQREAGLPLDPDLPLFAFIGRLVDQKGMDILLPILPAVLEEAQAEALGMGDPSYHEKLLALKEANPRLAVFLKFDEALAHHIYAGSDALLMPSWFEPCGLGQLIALRYGTLPVVRRTGGLADTVRDADSDPLGGTGFSFGEYRPEPLLDAVQRTTKAFGTPDRWRSLVKRAMTQDFSWAASTRKYEELYQAAIE